MPAVSPVNPDGIGVHIVNRINTEVAGVKAIFVGSTQMVIDATRAENRVYVWQDQFSVESTGSRGSASVIHPWLVGIADRDFLDTHYSTEAILDLGLIKNDVWAVLSGWKPEPGVELRATTPPVTVEALRGGYAITVLAFNASYIMTARNENSL